MKIRSLKRVMAVVLTALLAVTAMRFRSDRAFKCKGCRT